MDKVKITKDNLKFLLDLLDEATVNWHIEQAQQWVAQDKEKQSTVDGGENG